MNVRNLTVGIYLSVPVGLLLPETSADLGRRGDCCCGARWHLREVCSVDMAAGGQARGSAPQKHSCPRVDIHPRGSHQQGKVRAKKMGLTQTVWSVPCERISVNPNGYKDLCVFALSLIHWNFFWLLLSIFSIFISGFHLLKPPYLLNSCGFLFSFSSLSLISIPHTLLS